MGWSAASETHLAVAISEFGDSHLRISEIAHRYFDDLGSTIAKQLREKQSLAGTIPGTHALSADTMVNVLQGLLMRRRAGLAADRLEWPLKRAIEEILAN